MKYRKTIDSKILFYEFDVYCATMKKSKAIEYVKQYKEDVENSSN